MHGAGMEQATSWCFYVLLACEGVLLPGSLKKCCLGMVREDGCGSTVAMGYCTIYDLLKNTEVATAIMFASLTAISVDLERNYADLERMTGLHHRSYIASLLLLDCIIIQPCLPIIKQDFHR